MEKIRLDKWMLLTRIYKTRSQSTQACNKNKIDVKSFLINQFFHEFDLSIFELFINLIWIVYT